MNSPDNSLKLGDRLPELLALCLKQPTTPNSVYRYILNFLVNTPTPSEISAFRPTSEMQERLVTLSIRAKEGKLTMIEKQELDEYEHIEHLMVMLKTGKRPSN